MKGPSPLPAREKISGINPTQQLVNLANDLDADEETGSIKMRFDDNISKDCHTNYETNSFKVN